MLLLFKSLWSYGIVLQANRLRNPDPAEQVAGGISSLICCGLFVGLPLLLLAINIAILFWVAKDAKSRGMDGAMWLFLIFFTGFVGLAIYLFSRPQGRLTQCHNCGNIRMEASIKCPHCGAGQGRRERPDGDEEEEEDDRPVAKQNPSPRRSPPNAGAVFTCPYCGVRLRLPKQPLPLGHKFTCPKCQREIDVDDTE